MGPAGTGKSTLAAQFAFSAAGRGQKSLIFIFDESVATLLARCRAVSIDLDRYVDSGVIRVVKVNAAEISPSELVHNIRNLLESDPEIRLVSIDSMNGYLNAMISEKFLPLQLLELLTYLNDTGIATILTLVQHGMVGQELVTPLEVTYLADTVVLLRYFESRGAVKRALSVVKKRSGHHELTIREYSITKAGIVIGEPLKDFHGVLTGVPVYTGESSNLKKV
jgi:circadian clock protein KaiC